MSHFVLVHGSWSDAAVWQQVAAQLRDAGHRVIAPDLPAHGLDATLPTEASLDAYAATVVAAAHSLGGPVVLVGHSMAGTVISTVAELHPDLVSHLVYVAAFLLPTGQSLYGFTQTSPGMATSLLGANLRPGDDGTLGIELSAAREIFCADAPDDVATAAISRMRPDPLGPLGTPITVTDSKWGSVARSYIHTTADRAVSPASQAEMVAAVGAQATASIDSGHLPMLSRPTELTTAIFNLLN